MEDGTEEEQNAEKGESGGEPLTPMGSREKVRRKGVGAGTNGWRRRRRGEGRKPMGSGGPERGRGPARSLAGPRARPLPPTFRPSLPPGAGALAFPVPGRRGQGRGRSGNAAREASRGERRGVGEGGFWGGRGHAGAPPCCPRRPRPGVCGSSAARVRVRACVPAVRARERC